MKNRLTRSVLLFLVFLLAAVTAQAELVAGTTAPDFRLVDMDGRTVRLSDYKGHPFILKLATTWCPSCREQSAEFIKAKNFLTVNKIPVLEVFVDDTETDVRNYIRKYPLHEPHASMLDDGQVYEAYNVYLIPRVLVIDRNFKVVRDGSLVMANDLTPLLKKLL